MKSKLTHLLPLVIPYLLVTLAFTYAAYGIRYEHDARITTLCRQTQVSWDERMELANILTEPAVLSPQVAKLFPASQTESLRLQIDNANERKLQQRRELAVTNGPKPKC